MNQPGTTDVEKLSKHELLGSPVLESNNIEYSWRNILRVAEAPWIAEHIILNQILFPTSAYISMAGEAVRRVSNGDIDSYELRDFKINSALLLKPDDEVEIQTTLRPVETTELMTAWYEIQITSHDGSHWVERCVGRVSSLIRPTFKDSDVHPPEDTFPRQIMKSYWYNVMADIGLQYGPTFQGLDEISISIADPSAVATLSSFKDTTKYILHPIAIDQCFQILIIAAYQGQGRKVKELFVPTFIKHLVISGKGRCDGRRKLELRGTATKNDLAFLTGGNCFMSESGRPILSMQGCKFSVVPSIRSRDESKLFSFIHWDTDANLNNLNQALEPLLSDLDPSILLERLVLLHALKVGDSRASQGHIQKIQDKAVLRKQGGFGLINDISPFTKLNTTARNTAIELLKVQVIGTELESLGALVEHILTSDEPFSKDSAEREKILNQSLPLVRNGGILARPIKLLAHKNPKLRILELGSGGDETTRSILAALKSQYGEQMYLTYTYAATSPNAVNKAKKLFREIRNIDVVSFDIEDEVKKTTWKAGSYNLIITTDFLIPGRDLRNRVNRIKTLLHPLGRLFALEAFPEPEWALLVKGYLSDSSSTNTGIPKNNTSIRHVQVALLQSDFVFGSEEDGLSTRLKVIAELKRPLKHPNKITLVVPDHDHSLVNVVQSTFQDNGISCETCTSESALPQNQDIISLVDFHEPYLYNITEASFRGFASRLSNFKGSMIWATPISQISCKDPNSSMILGLTRTLRAELRKDLTVVEVDTEATSHVSLSKALLRLYQELGYRPKTKDIDPDYEYAIIDGDIKIPRLHWTTKKEELVHCTKFMENQGESHSIVISNALSTAHISFRSDACYLLVGGIGGLGRAISIWMVEHGARNILFLSRSAKESPETTPFFDELRIRGCVVSTFAGSVTNLSDVVAAIEQTNKDIAGIMQMSAVMRDNWMSQMTFAEWEQCVRPKVQGTWNLHHATSSAKLDFFLLFSSICGVTGQWGQANYNAANSFLDAFVNYRHHQNLPASVVDIGFMGSIGMAIENSALEEKLKASGYYFLREQDLIDALTIAIANSHPGKDRFTNKSQLGLGFRSSKPIATPSNRVVWKKDARMVLSHQFSSLGLITDDEARNSLKIAYQDRETWTEKTLHV